jgi:pimeloyl-ACP methyl ester carboxylesterase
MNSALTPDALVQAPSGSAFDASRPALVFLHGIGGRASGWAPVMAACAEAGWSCLAWDMPGYGDSPLISPYDFDGLSDALAALLRARGVRRAVLVGHSMGGMVALQHWARHAEQVAGLVLVASSPAFGNGSGEFQQRFVAARLAPLDAGQSLADLAPKLVPTMLAPKHEPAVREAAQACMGSISNDAYRAALHALVQFEQRAALATITVPTLCVAGELDQTSSPAVVERMASKIAGARYVCMPGVNHLLTFEQPQAFAQLLLDFGHTHFDQEAQP